MMVLYLERVVLGVVLGIVCGPVLGTFLVRIFENWINVISTIFLAIIFKIIVTTSIAIFNIETCEKDFQGFTDRHNRRRSS